MVNFDQPFTCVPEYLNSEMKLQHEENQRISKG